MGIETWNRFPRLLDRFVNNGVPLPCSDLNPQMKCNDTRWARDYCLMSHGACHYKIEAHFDCLEQFYPKEKVDQLRKVFKPNVLDYPTSDHYIRYANYYLPNMLNSKVNFDTLY